MFDYSRGDILLKCVFDSIDKSLPLGVQLERGLGSIPFTEYEETLLSFLCVSLGPKLRSLNYLRKVQYFSAQSFDFPVIITQMLHSRSIPELAIIIHNNLPKSFGFEHAELILVDPKSNFVSLTCIARELSKSVISKGDLVTSESYPSNSGIAGIAYTEKRPIFGIVGKTEYLFQDIDHVIMNGKVNNFLFVPLFGYDEEVVGVLELINKKDEYLSKRELEELEVYQRSIGLMIKHIEEMNMSLAASFGIKRLMHYIDKA